MEAIIKQFQVQTQKLEGTQQIGRYISQQKLGMNLLHKT